MTQDHRGLVVCWDQLVRGVEKVKKAIKVRKDQKETNETLERREKKETKAIMDNRARKDGRVQVEVARDQGDRKDLRETKAIKDLRETKATRDLRARKDQRETKVTRDIRARKIPRETLEIVDQRETKVIKDQKATRETKDRRDKQDQLVQEESKDQRGDAGQRGPQGPARTFCGTVATDVNMAGHKLYGLPSPTQDSEVATKKWVTDDFPTKSEVLNGFTFLGPLNMGSHKIYEVRTPTNNKDAANKKYVDDQSASTFKDGSTTTDQLDIRRVLSSIGIFEDVTFHSGAYSQDLDSASPSSAVVNKGSLQNGGMVGLDSLVTTIKGLLSTLQEQKFDADISLLVLKGTVVNHTIEHKDSSLVNNVVLRKVGNDTQLTMHFKKDLEHGNLLVRV